MNARVPPLAVAATPSAVEQLALASRRVRGVVRTIAAIDPSRAPAHDPRARALANQSASRAMCHAHDVVAHVRGSLPKPPFVLVSNHRSYFDPMVLGAVAPMLPIAKSEASTWPIVGARLAQLGCIFVKRGDSWSGARALIRVRDALARGASVLSFPEGTTSGAPSPLVFKRGVFGIAAREGISIVPCRIDYDDPAMCWLGAQTLFPHWWAVARRAQVVVRVRIGAPLVASRNAMPEAFAEETRAVIAALASATH